MHFMCVLIWPKSMHVVKNAVQRFLEIGNPLISDKIIVLLSLNLLNIQIRFFGYLD